MDRGTEIRLFDRRRRPPEWTEVIRAYECAVLLKNRMTSVPLAPDGQRYPKPGDATCIVFQNIDAAQQFCEDRVRVIPDLRCEIYDAQGLANPPLLVITHPDFRQEEHSGFLGSRGRIWFAGTLLLISVPLFWVGGRASENGILATFIAFNCVIVALRLLHWHFGVKHTEQERRRQLEMHRKMELNTLGARRR